MPRRPVQRWQPQSPKSGAFWASEGAAQLHPNADRGVLTWLCSSSGRGRCCDGSGFFTRRATATRVQQAEHDGNEEQRAIIPPARSTIALSVDIFLERKIFPAASASLWTVHIQPTRWAA